jgi:hypothetical protein
LEPPKEPDGQPAKSKSIQDFGGLMFQFISSKAHFANAATTVVTLLKTGAYTALAAGALVGCGLQNTTPSPVDVTQLSLEEMQALKPGTDVVFGNPETASELSSESSALKPQGIYIDLAQGYGRTCTRPARDRRANPCYAPAWFFNGSIAVDQSGFTNGRPVIVYNGGSSFWVAMYRRTAGSSVFGALTPSIWTYIGGKWMSQWGDSYNSAFSDGYHAVMIYMDRQGTSGSFYVSKGRW